MGDKGGGLEPLISEKPTKLGGEGEGEEGERTDDEFYEHLHLPLEFDQRKERISRNRSSGIQNHIKKFLDYTKFHKKRERGVRERGRRGGKVDVLTLPPLVMPEEWVGGMAVPGEGELVKQMRLLNRKLYRQVEAVGGVGREEVGHGVGEMSVNVYLPRYFAGMWFFKFSFLFIHFVLLLFFLSYTSPSLPSPPLSRYGFHARRNS